MQSLESNKQRIIDLMQMTRNHRRSLLDHDGFSSVQTIRKILADYPKLLDFNGLLVNKSQIK